MPPNTPTLANEPGVPNSTTTLSPARPVAAKRSVCCAYEPTRPTGTVNCENVFLSASTEPVALLIAHPKQSKPLVADVWSIAASHGTALLVIALTITIPAARVADGVPVAVTTASA